MKTNPLLLLLILLGALPSCTGNKAPSAEREGASTVLPDSKNEVTVVPLKLQAFEHELVSNGKVSAGEMAELRFQSAEVVAHIWAKNGDRVTKGEKIAELDKFRLDNKLAQAKEQLENAKLGLQDVLIGQGYDMGHPEKVPPDVMQLAKVKSGYDQSNAQYELAGYEDRNATLVAPFDGIVANLFTKPYNVANTAEAFCTLIAAHGMEAEFTVLESELPLIRKGDKVTISPYATTSAYEGSISEINPLVDEKGMVKVKARINSGKNLFTGMNVRVSVRRSLGKQLVIPKSAVVLRSGKQVVFTLKDGKAMWNYIHTGLENADSYTVADGLKEGDTVIVTGNINLAHEAPVKTIDDLRLDD